MRIGLIVIINSAMACAALAQDESPQELVQQANEQLRAGQYDEAIENYIQAEQLLPDAAEIAYNRAIAHYRKGDFEGATEQFITSLKTRDPQLEAKVKFNLGNCAYAAALAKKDNIPEAIEHLKSAILHYKDAIESNPQDKDARINIEMAQLLMKDLLDKQKQQQEQQQSQDQDKDQEKNQEQEQEQKQEQEEQNQQEDQPPEQQDQQQAGDQEQQEGEDQQQQQGQQQQDEQQPGQQQQTGEEQEQEQQQAQAAEDGQHEGQKGQERKMTREEARRLLQMIRDKEMQRRRELARRARVRLAPVDKDW